MEGKEEAHMLMAIMPITAEPGETFLRIVSANEAEFLEEVFEQNSRRKKKLVFTNEIGDTPLNLVDCEQESAAPFIAYGVIAPQCKTENWSPRLAKTLLGQHKDRFLQTVHFKNKAGHFETFAYHDFVLEPKLKTSSYIPCAFLMYSSMDYPAFIEENVFDEYFLGAAMSPAYDGFNVADNILNRDFVVVIRDIEPAFTGDGKRWKKFIDKEKMQKASAIM